VREKARQKARTRRHAKPRFPKARKPGLGRREWGKLLDRKTEEQQALRCKKQNGEHGESRGRTRKRKRESHDRFMRMPQREARTRVTRSSSREHDARPVLY
jgi:hypothetical protein